MTHCRHSLCAIGASKADVGIDSNNNICRLEIQQAFSETVIAIIVEICLFKRKVEAFSEVRPQSGIVYINFP